MLKDHELIVKIKKFFNTFFKSATRVYLSTFVLFVLMFMAVFVSPSIIGGHYNYADAAVNQYETLSNKLQVALVKKEYNPDKQLMRLDFSIKGTGIDQNLSNVQYDFSVVSIKGRKQHEVEVTRVNDSYLVVMVKGLEEGYSVVSTTITPSYIQPEIEKENDLEGKNLKMYVNETDKIVNTDLKMLSLDDYQVESIGFEQESVKKEIKDKENEIAAYELTNKELKEQNEKLEDDQKFQTEDEKIETQNTINSNVTTMESNEEDIDILKNEIDSLKEKVNLLDEKKKQYE